MVGRAAAFTILGLEPGADAAAIEKAYRRLIKQHHPDREGGDGVRAAEIIHAYRELRGGRAIADPLQFNEYFAGRKGRRWPFVLALAVVAVGPALLVTRYGLPFDIAPAAREAKLPFVARGRHTVREIMNEPLHAEAIDGAVAEARKLYAASDEMALAAASRDCQGRFRNRPSTETLDRCAAFDNAVIGLEDRDPLRDAGPFAPLAVTGRQWSAASALSDDYLAIDSRLDQIRVRVELELAPSAELGAEPQPSP